MLSKKFVRDLNRLITPEVRQTLAAAAQRAALPASTSSVSIDETSGVVEESAANLSVFYLVTSQMVTDPEGDWEFPTGFPTTNTYPISSTGPDQSVYLISRRVHERGLVGQNGDFYREVIPVDDWEQPYAGNGTYAPTYEVVNLTGTAPDGFAAAFAALPWSILLDDINDRYGIA